MTLTFTESKSGVDGVSKRRWNEYHVLADGHFIGIVRSRWVKNYKVIGNIRYDYRGYEKKWSATPAGQLRDVTRHAYTRRQAAEALLEDQDTP